MLNRGVKFERTLIMTDCYAEKQERCGLLRDVGCGLWVVGSRDHVGCWIVGVVGCGLWVPLWVACSGLLRDVGCGLCVLERCGSWVVGCLQWAERCGFWVVGS